MANRRSRRTLTNGDHVSYRCAEICAQNAVIRVWRRNRTRLMSRESSMGKDEVHLQMQTASWRLISSPLPGVASFEKVGPEITSSHLARGLPR